MLAKKFPLLPGVVLFFAALVICISVYQDYGMGWDEDTQRDIGLVSYNYIFKDDPRLLTYLERDHGVGFELPLLFLEQALNISDSRDVFLMRHLATHLFFLLSVFCGYMLVLRLLKNQWLACLAFIMLAFHPRIYAHSYLNSKDLPFLSMFLISFLAFESAFRKKTAWSFLLLGLAVGYTTSIRIMGILLASFIIAFLLIDLISGIMRKDRIVAPLVSLLSFAVAFCLSLVIAWPTLWSSPVENFIESYNSLSHFRWTGFVLFRGDLIPGDSLPWTYLPVWFCITTPPVWLILGFAGVLVFKLNLFRQPRAFFLNTRDRNFSLYMLCLFVPVLAVIFLDSVVYDDWRHVYFIYPAFVLLGVYALSLLEPKWRTVAAVACLLQILLTSASMIKIHPFQQVYFNRLVAHEDESLRKNYDQDYWGCSFMQGLNHIIEQDQRPEIKIAGLRAPIFNNIMMLQERDRKRFSVTDTLSNPDYFITNFRMHPQDYGFPEVFYDIKVQNSTILRVYKMHGN